MQVTRRKRTEVPLYYTSDIELFGFHMWKRKLIAPSWREAPQPNSKLQIKNQKVYIVKIYGSSL